jgi:hypothetical protein
VDGTLGAPDREGIVKTATAPIYVNVSVIEHPSAEQARRFWWRVFAGRRAVQRSYRICNLPVDADPARGRVGVEARVMPPYRIEIPVTVINWMYRIGIALMLLACAWIVLDQYWRMP